MTGLAATGYGGGRGIRSVFFGCPQAGRAPSTLARPHDVLGWRSRAEPAPPRKRQSGARAWEADESLSGFYGTAKQERLARKPGARIASSQETAGDRYA